MVSIIIIADIVILSVVADQYTYAALLVLIEGSAEILDGHRVVLIQPLHHERLEPTTVDTGKHKNQ